MNTRFMGMSYEQASREGGRIIELAAKLGNWCRVLDDLVELREIMERERVNER